MKTVIAPTIGRCALIVEPTSCETWAQVSIGDRIYYLPEKTLVVLTQLLMDLARTRHTSAHKAVADIYKELQEETPYNAED